MKSFKLGSIEIPSLGFGTWQIQGDVCTNAVNIALEVGYRHIDTATAYENHLAIKPALQKSGLKREDYFLTSKLWIDSFGKQQALDAAKRALDELGVDYLDLYLMHWPVRDAEILPTLEAFIELKETGLVKEWGVSNTTVHHLQDYIDKGFHPSNVQVEFHPSLNQKTLKEFCDKNNILLTAYSPIAQGADLKLEIIQKLAEKYSTSTSQVILNWIISKGIVAIPKASSRDHIQDNFNTLKWEMSEEDIKAIDEVNTNNRLIVPPWADFNY